MVFCMKWSSCASSVFRIYLYYIIFVWSRQNGQLQYCMKFAQNLIKITILYYLILLICFMYDASAFMKTLKQNATMSYNCGSVHTGTRWESRFRVREYMPDEKCELMNVAAYIDRNPRRSEVHAFTEGVLCCEV